MTEAYDWAAHYQASDTPWDLGCPHPELVRRMNPRELGVPGRALVPGCGHGHDAIALARADWDVTALDFVDLEAVTGEALTRFGGRFLATDALAFEPEAPFDLVFDHTFFCAIHPDQRADWGRMIGRVLRSGGTLAALVFPVGKPADLGGPPFGFDADAMEAALADGFERIVDEAAQNPVTERQWDERWALFRAP